MYNIILILVSQGEKKCAVRQGLEPGTPHSSLPTELSHCLTHYLPYRI